MVTFHHPYPRVGQTRAIARSGDLRHCGRRNRGLKDVSPPQPASSKAAIHNVHQGRCRKSLARLKHTCH
jgi:hypothetical protein